jgi:hypothetical protein
MNALENLEGLLVLALGYVKVLLSGFIQVVPPLVMQPTIKLVEAGTKVDENGDF